MDVMLKHWAYTAIGEKVPFIPEVVNSGTVRLSGGGEGGGGSGREAPPGHMLRDEVVGARDEHRARRRHGATEVESPPVRFLSAGRAWL